MLWLGWVLPLAYLAPNHYSPWVTFHQEMLAGIAFLPLIFVSLVDWRRRRNFPLIWWAPFLSIIPLAQMAGGEIFYFSDALVPGLYLLGFGLLLSFGSGTPFIKNSSDAIEFATPVFCAIIFSGVVSLFFQIHQWMNFGWLGVFIVDLKPGGRPYANLAQPNQLATLFLLGQLSLLCLFEQRKIDAVPALLIAALLSFGTGITQSRTAAVSTIAIVIIWLAYRKKIPTKLNFKGLLIPLVVYCFIFFGWKEINASLLIFDTLGVSHERFNKEARLNIWPQMIDAAFQSPWTGYGWNQVSIAQQQVAENYPPLHLYLESAHNIFIDLMLWVGVPTGIGIAGGFIFLLWKGTKKIRTPSELAIFLMPIAVAIHSFFEYPLSYSYFLFPIGLVGGILIRDSRIFMEKNARAEVLLLQKSFFIVSLIGGAAFFVLMAEYLKLEESWRQLQYQAAKIGEVEEIHLPKTYLLTGLYELSYMAQLVPKKEMSEKDIERSRRVVVRYGWGNLLFKYALIGGLNGRNKESSWALKVLCKTNSEKFCEKAKSSWRELRKEFPQLIDVDFQEAKK